MKTRVRVRVRVGGGMRYLRTEKLRSFHLRPFIVLTVRVGVRVSVSVSVRVI